MLVIDHVEGDNLLFDVLDPGAREFSQYAHYDATHIFNEYCEISH